MKEKWWNKYSSNKVAGRDMIIGVAGLIVLTGIFMLVMRLIYGGFLPCNEVRTLNCWPSPDHNETVNEYFQ